MGWSFAGIRDMGEVKNVRAHRSELTEILAYAYVLPQKSAEET